MANQKFDSNSSIAALKQQWRDRLKSLRQNISENRQREASLQACEKLYQKSQKASYVLSFASVDSEINLWALNEKLFQEKRLVLPTINHENKLIPLLVTNLNQLVAGRYGILEPKLQYETSINSVMIDIALVPGLGFDLKTNHRLGYGKGYYDRFLASAPSIKTWGIGFLEQTVENLPQCEHDIALHDIFLF